MFKKTLTLAMSAALLASPAQHAAAGKNDFAAGVVTGILGTIIVGQGVRRTRPPVTSGTTIITTRSAPPPGVIVETPERAAHRMTQTSLNHFGFDAGFADGVLGPRTAAAVRGYQSWMGWPVTGTLSPMEREVLVSAYGRAQAGDAETLHLLSSSADGPRVLLLAERDRVLGFSTPPVASSANFVAAAPPPAAVTTTTLPLIPLPTSAGDVAGFCNSSRVTGPRITPVSMTDPRPALDQAFCGARAEAMAESESLAAGVGSLTRADIEAQCSQFGPVLADYVGALSGSTPAEVLAKVNGFVDSTGADPAQLASSAHICLGLGYGMADMNVALGSALLLTSLGEPAYGELMGHHLLHGFGVAANETRAMEWLVWTTDRVATGATPVFGDGLRVDLVDEAVYRLNGGAPSSKTFDNKDRVILPAIRN